MGNATNVRVKPTKLTIDGKDYLIKYDFNAFIELEDIYGSIDDAMKAIQGEKVFEVDEKTGEAVLDVEGKKKPIMTEEIDKDGKKVYEADGKTPKMVQKRKISFKSIRDFLWVGLLYSDEKMTKQAAGKLLEFVNFKYVMETMIQAITASMPSEVDVEVKN